MSETEPSGIYKKILDVFLDAGVGTPLTITQIRDRLDEDAGSQEALSRRVRNLRSYGYDLPCESRKYTLRSATPIRDANVEPISGRLRAEVLNAAHGRCEQCGQTIREDHVKLQIDHRNPRDWGGSTERSNLWALCEQCNNGKRNFFESLDDTVMRKCMKYELPIQRIGELLKAFEGKPVPRRLLDVVSDSADSWPRRLRELRELGWTVSHVHDANEKGKYTHAYKLIESKPWPDDIPAVSRGGQSVPPVGGSKCTT